jgi:hypothetical protein
MEIINTHHFESVVSNNISKSKQEVIVTNSPNIYKGQGKTEQMLEYIQNAIKDLDVFIEKRDRGGYIAVAKKSGYFKKGSRKD